MSDIWKDIRQQNIGGSEIAGLFGESPYMTRLQLHHIKSGTIEADNLDDVEYIQAGNFLEQGIIDWANWKWGTNFIRPRTYITHATVKGMGCTPDAIDGPIMAQIKKIKGSVVTKNGWKVEGDVITDAPLHILLQVQQELACSGLNESHLIVMVDGISLHRMIIYRDETVIAAIEAEITKFWAAVQANDPPEPDFAADGDTIIKIRSRLMPIDVIDMTGNNQLTDAATKYLEAKAHIDNWETIKDTAKAEVMYLAGGAKKIFCGDINITIVDTKATPDTVITEADVGKVKKGRAGSSYPKITSTKKIF